jgi:hypothetical protein
MRKVFKIGLNYVKKHLVLILFFVYAGYLAFVFIRPQFFTDPIIQDDYALHYANAIETVNHLTSKSIGWGYSPQYCGGRLAFGINEFWFAAFILLLAPVFGAALSFNLSIIAGFFIPPISMYVMFKFFGFRQNSMITGLIFIMLGIIGMIPLRSFYYTGCFGFIIGTALCFLLLGITKRYVKSGSIVILFILCIVGSIAIVIHPLSAVVFLCLALPFVILQWQDLTLKTFILLIVAGLIATGLNLTWFIPHTQYLKVLEKGAVTGMQTHPFFFLEIIKENKAFAVLSILFSIQLFKLYVHKQYKDAITWSVSASLLSSIAFWGSQIGLNHFEPNRFIIPLIFLMMIVVASNIKIGFSRIKIVEPLLTVCFILMIIKPIPAYTIGFKKFPEVNKIVDALQKEKYDHGRVLFQDAYDHPWFDCHFAALIPVFTGRETTANTFRLSPPRYAQFVEDMLFGTTLDKIKEEELKENLCLFNISFILTYNDEARQFFNSCRLVTLDRNIENFTIYKVNNFEDNLCFNCSADISADNETIQIENARDSVTTLKYHYFKHLKVVPGSLTIAPVLLLNDPVPFIQIRNGAKHSFTIICK